MNFKMQGHIQESMARVSKSNRKAIQVLKDLIRINKDRITAYEKAAHEDNQVEPDISSILYRLAIESRAYVNELHAEVIRLGGAPVTQETISGKIYLFWLDLQLDQPVPHDPSVLPKECIGWEQAIQKAYQHALQTQSDLPSNIFYLVEKQLGGLERSAGSLLNE